MVDTLAATLSGVSQEATKREVLRSLASKYDPLGVARLITLVGKMVFRQGCVTPSLGCCFSQGTKSTMGEILGEVAW